jgi:hypothetical protein
LLNVVSLLCAAAAQVPVHAVSAGAAVPAAEDIACGSTHAVPTTTAAHSAVLRILFGQAIGQTLRTYSEVVKDTSDGLPHFHGQVSDELLQS